VWIEFGERCEEFGRRGDLASLRAAEDQRVAIGAQRPAAGFDAVGYVLGLRSRGVFIAYNGTAIVISPRAAINAVDEDVLRQHRDAVIATLTDRVER
jgi:hypothetical protein